MQTRKKETRGCWQWEKALGNGGFGEVSLWKNMENGKYIAIKTLQRQNDDRILERWKTEVEILLKLDHNNVVKGFTVPDELLEANTQSLAMQYCSGGDLRQFITKPEHRCGLPESDVKFIAHDVGSAIEYLHSMKIIHRDLKPENVVLQTCADVGGDCERTVYKLIDLGYAKDLDQDSIAKSFVGTWYYLAPELLESEKYTCTVDYWSFGIIMFEMITGLRPFLHNEKPISKLWQDSVQKKRSEVIHVFFNAQAQVQHSERLPTPNQLCRITRGYIEQWLRLMLLFDPKLRGGGFTEKKRRQCFEFLEQLLNVKVIRIFCAPSCQLLSYPLQRPHMQLDEVMTLVERETRIPIAKQDLLLSSGMEINRGKPAQQCIVDDLDDAECPIFLFDKRCNAEEFQPRKQLEMTEWVTRLTKEPATLFTVRDQRRAWYEALYFCRMTMKNLIQLQNAQRAALLCLLRNNTNFVRLNKELTTSIVMLRAKLEFFRKSLELDLRKFEEQTESGIFSQKMHQLWKQAEAKVHDFNNLEVETEQLEPKCVAIRSKVNELQKAQPKQTDSLNKIVEEAKQFVCRYENVKEPITHEGIVEAVKKCHKAHRDLSTSLHAYISKICRCKQELTQLLQQVETQVQNIVQASNQLVALQNERQRNVWKLLEVALKQTSPLSPLDSPSVNGLPLAQLSLSPAAFQRDRDESVLVIHEHRTAKDEFSSILENLKESHETSLDWTFLDTLVPQLPEEGTTGNT